MGIGDWLKGTRSTSKAAPPAPAEIVVARPARGLQAFLSPAGRRDFETRIAKGQLAEVMIFANPDVATRWYGTFFESSMALRPSHGGGILLCSGLLSDNFRKENEHFAALLFGQEDRAEGDWIETARTAAIESASPDEILSAPGSDVAGWLSRVYQAVAVYRRDAPGLFRYSKGWSVFYQFDIEKSRGVWYSNFVHMLRVISAERVAKSPHGRCGYDVVLAEVLEGSQQWVNLIVTTSDPAPRDGHPVLSKMFGHNDPAMQGEVEEIRNDVLDATNCRVIRRAHFDPKTM